MYAYIILSLILAVFATDLVSGGPANPWIALGGTWAVTVLVLLAGLAISGYILLRRHRIEANEQRFLRMVGLLGRLYRMLIVAAYAFVLFGCGWSRAATDWAGIGNWRVPVLALNLLPLVVLLLVGWTALFWADRSLRALMFRRAGAPVAARHWTLSRYVAFMLRQYLLVILVPMLFLLGVNETAARLLPDTAAAAVGFGVLVAAALLAGPWVCFCWRTESLPRGRLRRRLVDLARRAGIRVADVRIWRTNLSIANGCMIGLVGPLRYVLITDALLLSLSPEEVESVFAHEAAHVTYRHPLLFFVMTLAAMAVAVVMGEAMAMATNSFWVGIASMGTLVLAYLVVVFGYVSRRCEQECDLFAVRAMECPEGCSPPDARRKTGGKAAPPPPSEGQETGPGEGQNAGQGEQAPSDAWAVPTQAADDIDDPPPESEAPEEENEQTEANQAAAETDEAAEEEEAGRAEAPAPPSDESPVPAGSVCPHRVRTFITALRRIGRLNGAPETRRGLRHFSIARRCRFLEQILADPSRARRSEQRIRRLKKVALLLALFALLVASVTVAASMAVVEDVPLQPDEPEDPTRPEEEVPWEDTWIARLVDRHQVHPVAVGPPQFDRDADVVADLRYGRVAFVRRGVAPGDHDVAVADARGHAVAVHPQGERAGRDVAEAGHPEELRDALRRGGG
jgi:Zn-dependent protease with chaperone function